MPELRVRPDYLPLPRQSAFHRSRAKIRAYGGAMGGGKSRALCQDVLRDLLVHPGIVIVIMRLSHVSLALSTKRTMILEVFPPELLVRCTRKQSGGEDYVKLPNGSVVHFAGLDDPERWFSSEIGGVAFDEAHQISEEAVVKMMSRLRQRDMPRRVRLAFNPENPGHWLYRWFVAGAEKTQYGYKKKEVFPSESTASIGSSEFVFAPPSSNPFLPEGYEDENLAGMPELLRRRYQDGEWLFVTGSSFFDLEALTHYADRCARPLGRYDFEVTASGSQARLRERDTGMIRVFAEPKEGRGYAIGADVASGSGRDFSAAYVVDLASMELVCEFHGKLDEDLFAEQLHFLGRWYNSALVAVEYQGGFGAATLISLRDGKGGRPKYPSLYRHSLDLQVDLPITKRYGFPMTQATRRPVLGELAKALREQSLPFLTDRLLDECNTFVNFESGTTPRAQDGCNDDCVLAAAVALEMYRKKGAHPLRDLRLSGRKRRRARVVKYPWQKVA